MKLQLSGTVDVEGFRLEIDLVVEPGETVALVGPNGAGKTTVVRAIAGLQPLSTGRLSCRGSVWDDPGAGRFVAPRNRRVGVVFQQYLLFDHLTASENVAFGVRAAGGDRDASMRAARALLGRLEIADVADRRPPQLSGGQAQRVALARALAIEPQVLLLDEPLAALDASTRASVRSELGGWIAGGTSRLVVTHDPVDVSALADRVVVLEGGAVSQRGTLSELAAAPRSDYVADLMATNLLRGVITGRRFMVDRGSELAVGAHDVGDGNGLVAIRPTSISLHRTRPEGSPRNVWSSRINRIDRFHDRVRVSLENPLRVAVEVTEAGLAALDLDLGDEVWASVKASEITVVALR